MESIPHSSHVSLFYERLSEVDYQLCIILKPVRESGEILQESMNHGQTRDRSYEERISETRTLSKRRSQRLVNGKRDEINVGVA
jgi:hypothetical protein